MFFDIFVLSNEDGAVYLSNNSDVISHENTCASNAVRVAFLYQGASEDSEEVIGLKGASSYDEESQNTNIIWEPNNVREDAYYAINQDINNPDVEIPAVSQIDCENPSRVLTASVTAYNSHTVSYKWSQTETISTITVSVGGPYSVTVTDDVNKCSAVASVVVAQSSDLPTVTIPAVSDLNCQTTQTVLVVNVEGAANIKYEWNKGGSTTSTSNVTEGEYKVTVTNLDNNCSVVATQTVTKDVTIPVITLSPTTMLDCKVTNAKAFIRLYFRPAQYGVNTLGVMVKKALMQDLQLMMITQLLRLTK